MTPDPVRPSKEKRSEREIVNGWADDLLDTATSGFNYRESVPHAKPHDQRVIEAAHWIAGEIRALRFALAADTEPEEQP